MTLALTFPGGELKTITISATAGNVTTNKNPGARKRWVLLYGRIALVTDATVANRFIRTYITDGSNLLAELDTSPAVTASLTRNFHYIKTDVNACTLPNNAVGMLEIEGIIIEGADQFRITIDGGVVGDSYSGFIRVLEIGL